MRHSLLSIRILLAKSIIVSISLLLFFVLVLIAVRNFALFYREPARGSGTESSIKASKTDIPEYMIFIEVEDKTLYLLEDGVCIKKYPVATGTGGMPSPLGSWKIIEKGDWGEGFGGRWMGLNVPWGIYGIHGTNKERTIGSAASHGCIRMYKSDVAELYSIVRIGTPVAIVDGSFGAFGRGFKNIKPGNGGADVLEIQRRLKQLGYYKGGLDGMYGEGMKSAVHKFQCDYNLPVENTITKDMWLAMGFREFE